MNHRAVPTHGKHFAVTVFIEAKIAAVFHPGDSREVFACGAVHRLPSGGDLTLGVAVGHDETELTHDE